MNRIDVLITDPSTGAVVSRFNTSSSRFAARRIARVTANDPSLIVGRWLTPKPRRVPLRLPSQRSPR